MKHEVDIVQKKGQNFFGKWSRRTLIKDGEKILKEHPEYKYLEEDPWLTMGHNLYISVVYAYMVDEILKIHPELKDRYMEFVDQQTRNAKHVIGFNGKEHKSYSMMNETFLEWYNDQLREQANPGILERERQERIREQAQKDKELQESIELHRQIDAYYAAKHPHVECPYCHSMNTEKISGVARGVSIYALGVASPKLGKQWHCNNCKSDF